jgi:hypothetical protein
MFWLYQYLFSFVTQLTCWYSFVISRLISPYELHVFYWSLYVVIPATCKSSIFVSMRLHFSMQKGHVHMLTIWTISVTSAESQILISVPSDKLFIKESQPTYFVRMVVGQRNVWTQHMLIQLFRAKNWIVHLTIVYQNYHGMHIYRNSIVFGWTLLYSTALSSYQSYSCTKLRRTMYQLVFDLRITSPRNGT